MATTMGGSGPQVREASRALLPPGASAHPVRLWGTEALLFRRLDAREDERRRTAGAARLDYIGHLETLMALPVDLPVPLRSLDPGMRKKIRSLPQGAVEIDRHHVTRRAVRPMRPELAVVKAVGWRAGLEKAGRFAPVCRRAMLLERDVPGLDDLLVEAAYYGVGVLAPRSGGLEMIAEPQEFRPARHTAAAWLLVEEIYQHVDNPKSS